MLLSTSATIAPPHDCVAGIGDCVAGSFDRALPGTVFCHIPAYGLKIFQGVKRAMHDLLPDGEDVRRAIKWVSGNLQENPGQPVGPLVQEAIFKFDFSPRDAEFLIGFFRQREEES